MSPMVRADDDDAGDQMRKDGAPRRRGHPTPGNATGLRLYIVFALYTYMGSLPLCVSGLQSGNCTLNGDLEGY